ELNPAGYSPPLRRQKETAAGGSPSSIRTAARPAAAPLVARPGCARTCKPWERAVILSASTLLEAGLSGGQVAEKSMRNVTAEIGTHLAVRAHVLARPGHSAIFRRIPCGG